MPKKNNDHEQGEKAPKSSDDAPIAFPFLRLKPPLDEATMEELTKQLLGNDRFLAAIDAFAKGHGTFGDLIEHAYEDKQRSPMVFDFDQFSAITLRLVDRIKAAELIIPDEARNKYPHFYKK